MRTASLILPLMFATCSAIAFAQNVPGTPPKDPPGYQSPYGIKTTSKEICARDYRSVLLETQAKMQRMRSTNTCAMVEAMQEISQDYASFDHRCPDFPAAKQAEAINRANIEALRGECRGKVVTQSPLPTAIIDPYAQQMTGIQGCMITEDGKPLSRDQQVECIRKNRQQRDRK